MSAPLGSLALAAENVGILRRLAGPHEANRLTRLAEALGRDKSNLSKTLQAMTEAGLVTKDGPGVWSLTDAGRKALSAVDVMEGAAPVSVARTAPHGAFRPNPLNPRKRFAPDDATYDQLRAVYDGDEPQHPWRADAELMLSIETEGLLQPLRAYPPDASGARMLNVGERRWRAVGRLLAAGRPFKGGPELPFVEADEDPTRAPLIALVENGRREPLTPLERARGVQAFLDAHPDWSARRVALAVHESPRVIQEDVRVLRLTAPEDLAAHERGEKSWEALRYAAREARPNSPPPGECSPERDPDEQPLPLEARGFEGVPSTVAEALFRHPPTNTVVWLCIQDVPGAGFAVSQSIQHRTSYYGNSTGWPRRGEAVYATHDAAIAEGVRRVLARVGEDSSWRDPPGFRAWADSPASWATDPLVVDGVRHLNAHRAGEARRALEGRPAANHHQQKAETPDAPAAPAKPPQPGTPQQALALVELAYKIRTDPAPDRPGWTIVGATWLSTVWIGLAQDGWVAREHRAGERAVATLSDQARAWLLRQRLAHQGEVWVSKPDLIHWANRAGAAPWDGARYATSFLNDPPPADPAPEPEPAAEPEPADEREAQPPAEPSQDGDRPVLDQDAAMQLLADVDAAIEAFDTGHALSADLSVLAMRAGLTGPFRASDGIDPDEVLGAGGVVALVTGSADSADEDADQVLRRAQARLVAFALDFTFGFPADAQEPA